MKLRRWSFFLIIMVMFALILGACNSNDEPQATENNDPGTNENNQENDEEVPEETYDLGGRVITIASHWDMSPEEGTEMGDLKVERLKEVEEKYNITVEWIEVPYFEKGEQLTASVLAGEPFADIVQLDIPYSAGLAQEGYIHAIDDLIDISDTKMNDGIQELGRVLPDGKVYLAGTLGSLAEGGGLYYNKTMFEQAGLDDPYELQQNGEWTWETFLHAARTLTTGDQYGLSAEPYGIANTLIASNDAYIFNPQSEEITLDDPRTMEALEFMSDLYHVHNVVKPNDRSSNWEDPPIFFDEGLVGMTTGPTWQAGDRLEASFDWGYVFFPLGPNSTEYNALRSGGENMVFPQGIEDPEMVYKIWEDMQIWEYEREDQIAWFESIFPNEESVDTAIQMLDNIRVDMWRAYNLADLFYGPFERISGGDGTPAQIVAETIPEAQARVESFFRGEAFEDSGEDSDEDSNENSEEESNEE